MLPTRSQRRFIITTLSLLAITGLSWTYIDQTSKSRAAVEIKQWILSLHAAFGFLMFLIFGGLISQHIAPMISAGNRKRRRSGLTTLGLISLQIISVYVLYYGGGPIREYAEVLHLWLGLSLVALLSVHLRPKSR